jgi:hypothetical protein
MKCSACSRQIADGSAFCPYCGGRPDAAPSDSEATAAFDARDLARLLDADDDDDPTVSMSADELGLAEALAAHAAAQAKARQPAVAAAAPPEDDFDDAGATVAMVLPPGFADALEDVAAAAETSPKTIMGRPGAAGPPAAAARPEQAARGPERGPEIDPFGQTLQSPAITDEELQALTPGVVGQQNFVSPSSARATATAAPDVALGPVGMGAAAAGGPPTQAIRPAKKGGGKVTIIVAALVLALIVTAAVLLLRHGGGAGGSSGRLAEQNLPKDVDGVIGVSWDAVRATWIYEKAGPALKKQIESEPSGQKLADLGLSLDGISGVAVGLKTTSDGSPGSVVVGQATFDKAKVLATLEEQQGDEEKVAIGGTDFYGKPTRMIVGLLADDLVLGGPKELVELAMAARSSGETLDKNEGFRAALASVDADAPIWGAAIVNAQTLSMAESSGGGVLSTYVMAGDAFGFSVDMSGDVVLRAGAVFSDEERAEKARVAVDQGVAFLKMGIQLGAKDKIPEAYRDDVPKLLDSITLSRDGAVVQLAFTVPKALAERALSDAIKQYGAGGSMADQ